MDYEPGRSYFMLLSFQPEHALKLCKVAHVGERRENGQRGVGLNLGHKFCRALCGDGEGGRVHLFEPGQLQ